MTLVDVMAFRAIQDPVVSDRSEWIAFELRPDRGDGELRIRSLQSATSYSLERGSRPVFSRDATWLAARVEAPYLEREKSNNSSDDQPRPGMALFDLSNGATTLLERVEEFRFSQDSRWLFYHRSQEGKEKEDSNSGDSREGAEPDKKKPKQRVGRTLVLRHLERGAETEISNVEFFSVDEDSKYIVYSLAIKDGTGNGLLFRRLTPALSEAQQLAARDRGRYTHLEWDKQGNRMAFLSAVDDEHGKPGPAELEIWDGERLFKAILLEQAPEGWMLPSQNRLEWSRDGQRLFFGFRPREQEDAPEEDSEENETGSETLYDIEKIRSKRGVDVWHWLDDRINPQQKKMWDRMREQTYRGVYHLDSQQFVQLADVTVPEIRTSQIGPAVLGLSDVPYLRETTWGETVADLYHVDLQTGTRRRITERLLDRRSVSISPNGRFVAFYKDGSWWMYDQKTAQLRNLTSRLEVPFRNEDHDYPGQVPGYGSAGWVEDSSAVLIYDKYDVWEFPGSPGDPLNLTAGKGRAGQTVFRIVRLEPDEPFIKAGQRLLLTGYRDLRKNNGFFEATEGSAGVQVLLEEEKRFRFVAKAKESDTLVFSRESYSEFPDLWTAAGDFSNPRRITDVHPEIDEFAWGSAELVDWRSLDGKPLQGVLIKPGNYEPGKRYPVIVYFYRFFSQRLHEFNPVVVNHRPCFPYYSSNGYALFLPDIRFEVGRPGPAAVKSLVPGVQKLIDIGVADPEAVGLHGHSWSGYQTAFIITQTDLFAAAVAGAPVSNMTSAYGGIRWGSGRARQFQYEKTQSRIGGSLWDSLPEYIENSPLFFADRINTPLLIQFGDEDDAVPWYQGIELYLAMRRLGKECVFLQYRGEPHHLRKYANKLDYTIKMREYFDHYLKGEPAKAWMTQGAPYDGK